MFRSQMLAIFRLYNENLTIGYRCICRGCVECRGGGAPPPLHSTHPLQMHVQLIVKFSLYNLKMVNICDRNM